MLVEGQRQKTKKDRDVLLDALFYESGGLSSLFYLYVSRFLDLLLAFLGFLLALPLLVICAIAIKLDTKGPVFYYQERVGLKGKNFRLIKLRTMAVEAEMDGPQWACPDDPRITRTGRWMRRARIDEVPQLINVMKGEMSLIGPRPERPYFVTKFNNEIHGFNLRLSVKPGLTGWAQVNGGYDITPDEKLNYDLEYIRNRNFLLDIKIILKTIKVVFTGSGAR